MTAEEFLIRKKIEDGKICQTRYVVNRSFTLSELLEDFAETKTEDLKNEIKITEALLKEREKLLEAIPECKNHGKCVPHALEWIKANLPTKKEFKSSMRAEQIAKLINVIAGIELEPSIYRRYKENDGVKFEMQDTMGDTWYFEGTVLEFLDPEAEIDCQEKHFMICNREELNDYTIQ